VTGGTLTGVTHLSLVVYTDGLVSLATDAGATSQLVDADLVAELVRDLRRAGALRLKDRAGTATDVPLTTVSAFVNPGRPPARSVANTFSYLAPEGAYAAVEEVIQDFIDGLSR
jgi:hypothetical protein